MFFHFSLRFAVLARVLRFSLHFPILVHKGERGKGERGKGEWSGAKASGLRASGARESEARVSKARLRAEEQEKADQQRFPLSSSSSSSKLLQFFPRAIAPFTGKKMAIFLTIFLWEDTRFYHNFLQVLI